MAFNREYAGVDKPHIYFNREKGKWVYAYKPPSESFQLLAPSIYAHKFCSRLNRRRIGVYV